MNRPAPSRVASWRAAYDVTETQAHALVALMAAQTLGFGGATTKALRWLGLTPTEAHSVSGLRHVGLVEIAGYVDGTRDTIYRATERAFRRFSLPAPRLVPVQTAAGRAEMIAERNKRRDYDQARRWRERQKMGAVG